MKLPLNYDGCGINEAGGERIATLNTKMHTHDTGRPVRNPEHDALGRLLAAAPPLAAALAGLAKYCVGRLDRNVYTIPEYKAALQALAYATYQGDGKDVNLDTIIAEFSPK